MGKENPIPRLSLECIDFSKSTLPFIQTQFSVKLCFALTINKSQDKQWIIFVRTRFYTRPIICCLSQGQTSNVLKMLIQPSIVADFPTTLTSNIVYTKILQLATLVENIAY